MSATHRRRRVRFRWEIKEVNWLLAILTWTLNTESPNEGPAHKLNRIFFSLKLEFPVTYTQHRKSRVNLTPIRHGITQLHKHFSWKNITLSKWIITAVKITWQCTLFSHFCWVLNASTRKLCIFHFLNHYSCYDNITLHSFLALLLSVERVNA